MNKQLYIALLFVFLLSIQVLLLNNILLFGYVNPYLYIAFVFLYPLNKNRFPFLSLAFLLGLGVDFFANTGGVNAFAILCIAFIRLFLINSIFKKTSSDYILFKLSKEPFGKVFNFVSILTVIHHFILFSLINFSFHNFSNVLINTLLSSIFTLLLYFLGSFIFRKNA